MSRELLKEILDQHEKGFIEANNTRARVLLKKIEAELAKPDEPFGYIGGAWARIAANGGAWDSITVSREKLDGADCALYANPPRQQEPLSKEDSKKLCTDFYFWWHNQPGTNTIEGFDEWWEQLTHGIGGGK